MPPARRGRDGGRGRPGPLPRARRVAAPRGGLEDDRPGGGRRGRGRRERRASSRSRSPRSPSPGGRGCRGCSWSTARGSRDGTAPVRSSRCARCSCARSRGRRCGSACPSRCRSQASRAPSARTASPSATCRIRWRSSRRPEPRAGPADGEALRLVWVGRLAPEKDPVLAVRALDHLRERPRRHARRLRQRAAGARARAAQRGEAVADPAREPALARGPGRPGAGARLPLDVALGQRAGGGPRGPRARRARDLHPRRRRSAVLRASGSRALLRRARRPRGARGRDGRAGRRL